VSVSLANPQDTNLWHKDETAQAFWDQHRALPYRELLADTIAWCEPKAGQAWLDLGCGGGHLLAGLWRASGGQIGRIAAADCAAANEQAIARLCSRVQPTPRPEQTSFAVVDFSHGLPQFEDASFDGIVSGLAISYAESFDERRQQYTDAAYNHLYTELHRILKPSGRLVFSVNVPNPNFWKIVWKSFGKGVRLGKPFRTLKNVVAMQRHGSWLKREARRGRFHFLPIHGIFERMAAAGFIGLDHKLSYAGQAFVVRGFKE
jgi:ubiquinone/menaquinone biosynthesis C-methylase UbiE